MENNWFDLLQLYTVCGLLVIVFLAIVGSILYALLINQRLLGGGVMIRVRWKKSWKHYPTTIGYSYRFNGFVIWRSCELTDFDRTQLQHIISLLRVSEDYGLCSLFRMYDLEHLIPHIQTCATITSKKQYMLLYWFKDNAERIELIQFLLDEDKRRRSK